jgi:hypothetical protein
MGPCCCCSRGRLAVQLAKLRVSAAAADPDWHTGYVGATDELH